MSDTTRQLAAIMFADIVGYTSLMQENETLATEKRAKFRTCVEERVAAHKGRIIQYYGDGVMCMFGSALGAVRSAISLQTQFLSEPRVDARIGIHVGEIMTDGAGAYGDGVNIASRMESLAIPGSVCISDRLFGEIKNQQDIIVKPLGFFELKNVHQPMQVYAIANTGLVVPSRDEVKGKLKQTLNSIAVLPLASLSTDPENEYFCDGLSEELINVLSNIEGLQVTARTSAFAFKGKNEDIRQIAAQLNVQKVIEGSVRKAGNKMRITVQLINAVDGYHIWSETYDRSVEDIFEIQDEISRSVANKLRANLTTSEHEHQLVKPPTENLEAYKKYLQGLHYWNTQNVEQIENALECFHAAVALEPGFVNPYYNIVYITSIFPHIGVMSIEQARSICTDAATRAMEIDPMNPRSLLAAGINAFYLEWDMPKAERYFQKAVELNPSLYEAHFLLGWYYMIMRRPDMLEEPLMNAYRLDPMGGETVPGIGEICLFTGDLDRAVAFCDEGLRNNPESFYARTIKALAVGFQGDWKQTMHLIEPVQHFVSEFPLMYAFVGFAQIQLGDVAKAQECIDRLLQIRDTPDSAPVSPHLALIYLGLGDKERFYTYFEEAMREKALTILYLYNSPFFAEVNGEERIKRIREEHGLPA